MNLKTMTALLATAMTLGLAATGPALADGDAASGQRVFNRCKTCHVLEGDQKRLGPSLECVLGRTSGTLEGFKYSPAMAGAGIVWSHDTLAEYLKNPKALVPGNRMMFPGLNNPQDIEDLIAYLKSTSANCPK